MYALLAFAIYIGLVWLLKWATYQRTWRNRFGVMQPHEHICALTLFFSPDAWFASYYKHRIRQIEFYPDTTHVLNRFIRTNNYLNILVSIALFILISVAHTLSMGSITYNLVAATCLIRYFSRSYEISRAFTLDVFEERKSESGLTKHQRIKLAMLSYSEIFLYSAAAYLVLFPSLNPVDASIASMSVGTFVNAAEILDKLNGPLRGLAFIQIVSTLSLVVLSLASYLSRSAEA